MRELVPRVEVLNSVLVHGINSRGAIVGTASVREGRRGVWAFLYRPGAASAIALDSAYHSEAWAINEREEVTGCSSSSDGDLKAFVWLPDRTPETFRRISLGKGIGRAISPKGEVAVSVEDGPNYIFTPTGGKDDTGNFQTVVRRPLGRFVDDTFPQPPGPLFFDLTGRNRSGTIIGTLTLNSTDGPPTRGLVLQNGVARLLGDDAHTHISLNAINDAGTTVGRWSYHYQPDKDSSFFGTYFYHAVMFDRQGSHDLGALGSDPDSEALAINNAGVIVGQSGAGLGIGYEHAAFIVQGGTMFDLNACIPTGSGWKLTEAQAINTHGQIAGMGTKDGRLAVFLLTPDPTPGENRRHALK